MGTQQRGWQTNFLRKAEQSVISCSKSCGTQAQLRLERRAGSGRPGSARTEENAKLLLQKFSQSATDFVLSIVRWSDQEELFVCKENKVSGILRELLKQKLGALHANSAVRVCQLLLKHFSCKSLQIIWDTDDRWIHVSSDISQTVLWSCGLSSWLRTKALVVSTFSSVRAQIYGKSKQTKAQWYGKSYLQSVQRKTRYFKHRKYQNLWMNNKVRGDEKMHSVCVFFHIWRKFEFLVSRGSVATCLRCGG